jgi:hypothetical protein
MLRILQVVVLTAGISQLVEAEPIILGSPFLTVDGNTVVVDLGKTPAPTFISVTGSVSSKTPDNDDSIPIPVTLRAALTRSSLQTIFGVEDILNSFEFTGKPSVFVDFRDILDGGGSRPNVAHIESAGVSEDGRSIRFTISESISICSIRLFFKAASGKTTVLSFDRLGQRMPTIRSVVGEFDDSVIITRLLHAERPTDTTCAGATKILRRVCLDLRFGHVPTIVPLRV